MNLVGLLVLLLTGWFRMTTAVWRWVRVADERAIVKGLREAKDFKTADQLESSIEKTANGRRVRFWVSMAAPLITTVAATVLWRYEAGLDVTDQVYGVGGSVVFGGWVIYRPETNAQVDTAVGFTLLLGNVAYAWILAPTVVMLCGLVFLVGYVLYGAGWQATRPTAAKTGKPNAAATVAGRVDESAIVTAIGSAIPAVRGMVDKAVKETARTGRKHQVFLPFVVATNDTGVVSATVELPTGTSVDQLLDGKAAKKFAGALGKSVEQCVIREGEHASQLELAIMPRPPHEMPLPEWPHWETPVLNPERFCLGFDESNDPVMVRWADANSIFIAGMKRSGKSNPMRAIGLALCLQSPHVRLHFVNGKATGDFNMFDPVAHTHISGKDAKEASEFLALLQWVDAEADRRAEILRTNTDHFGDQKFRPSDLGPKWGVYADRIIVDEIDSLLAVPVLGPKIAECLSQLGRKLGAAQFAMILATQSLVGENMPNEILNSCETRICHHVATHSDAYSALGGTDWGGAKPWQFRYSKNPPPTVMAVLIKATRFRVSLLSKAERLILCGCRSSI